MGFFYQKVYQDTVKQPVQSILIPQYEHHVLIEVIPVLYGKEIVPRVTPCKSILDIEISPLS